MHAISGKLLVSKSSSDFSSEAANGSSGKTLKEELLRLKWVKFGVCTTCTGSTALTPDTSATTLQEQQYLSEGYPNTWMDLTLIVDIVDGDSTKPVLLVFHDGDYPWKMHCPLEGEGNKHASV